MNKIFDYSNLTLSQLITKIDTSRFFNLPKMVAEALRKIPSGGGSEPAYKVYTALLTQSGTDAPVATVLENTLEYTPLFMYTGEGVYNMVLQNTPFNKIVILNQYKKIFAQNKIVTIYPDDDNLISIISNDLSEVSADNIISNDLIEIRAYN